MKLPNLVHLFIILVCIQDIKERLLNVTTTVIQTYPLIGVGTLYDSYASMHAKLLQSCPTLGDPMDCSLPGSSVYGILQARILEWVAFSSSPGSSQGLSPCLICLLRDGFFTTSGTW